MSHPRDPVEDALDLLLAQHPVEASDQMAQDVLARLQLVSHDDLLEDELDTLLAEMPITADDHFTTATLQRIFEAENKPANRTRGIWPLPAWANGLAAAAVVTLGALSLLQMPEADGPSLPAMAQTQVSQPAAEQVATRTQQNRPLAVTTPVASRQVAGPVYFANLDLTNSRTGDRLFFQEAQPHPSMIQVDAQAVDDPMLTAQDPLLHELVRLANGLESAEPLLGDTTLRTLHMLSY